MEKGTDGDQAAAHDLRAELPGQSLAAVYDLPSSTTWATFLIIAVNTVVFAAMAATSQRVWIFDVGSVAAWGGNSGLLDLAGQWWRLLTYQFLHIGLFHIAINMWVMWSVGRLVERLYGSLSLLFIYLLSGIFAGLVSIAWNPDKIGVGASGAIFGLLGALVVFLSISRNDVPMWALRYWIPISVFVVFCLVNGAIEPGVDNAAHVGGLFAGFIIGAATIRPADLRHPLPVKRGAIATIALCACAVPFLWYLDAGRQRSSTVAEFAAAHEWYISAEAQNLLLWQNLAAQAANQTISQDELTRRFETDILPFWRNADARLEKELAERRSNQNPAVPLVAEFARQRLGWAQAIITAQDNTPDHIQAALNYAQQTSFTQAKIDRLQLLDAAENMPRPLSDGAIVRWAKDLLSTQPKQCVAEPFVRPVAATDAPNDGPAQRKTIGCQAQQMFTAGDYVELDNDLRKYSENLADLPDGSSRYEGVWSGLDDLFANGQISLDEALRRAAEWRRAVPGSVEPSLAEALIFRDWAYGARGHGYASSVSPVAMQAYLARSEMAAESLRVMRPGERKPEWYSLSLGLGRDLSVPATEVRATFEEGRTKYRAYFPLYRNMLVSLMPRWGGSVDLVDEFVLTSSKQAGTGLVDPAFYVRLYLAYADLEGGDFNVVEAAKADPALMKIGIESLRKRYPNSDYVLNSVTRFTCIDNEVFAYRALRAIMRNHVSATAWPDSASVATCDKWSD